MSKLLACFMAMAFLLMGHSHGAFAAGFTKIYPNPLQLEFMTDSTLCGTTLKSAPNVAAKNQSGGRRICIGESDTMISANDTVSRLQYFVMGEGILCGVDERGVRCWKSDGRYEKPVQDILASGDTPRAKISRGHICVPQADKTIHCFSALQNIWTADGEKKIRMPEQILGPFANLQDFQMTEDAICILESGKVTCSTFPHPDEHFGVSAPDAPTQVFTGARALYVSWDTVCVLGDNGLDCTRGRGGSQPQTFHAGGAWKNVTKIFSNSGTGVVCGVDAAEQPVCVRLGTDAGDVTDATPPELAGLQVLKFKSVGDNRCAIVTTATEQRALYCGVFQTMKKVAIADHDIADFEVAIDSVCAVTTKGLVRCFYGETNMDSPLPEDGSLPQAAGRCRWNKSHFHCGGTDFEALSDLADIKTVIAAAVDPRDIMGFPCIIYENASGIRGVRCIGSDSPVDSSISFPSDMNRITTGSGYTCAFGGTDTQCWGDPLGGVTPPNIMQAKDILFGDDFGCANDRFGLTCWGRGLDERGLTVPSSLQDVDAVLDFGVGEEHACAIDRNHRLQCWGKDADATNVPNLTNVVSVKVAKKATCASSDEGVTCWGERGTDLMSVATPFQKKMRGAR